MKSFDASEIVRRWQDQFGIDVAPLFDGIERMELRSDPQTGLALFEPAVVGDAALYEALQQLPWYYLEDKWEYRFALSRLVEPMHILEVGCGRGAFLRAAKAAGHKGIGLELNADAAAHAGRRGLDVRTEMLEHFAHGRAAEFDRVYSFQVLEHVVDPLGMLRDMLRVVRPGGRVCLAVPNADSFIGRHENILDMPPHHVSHWRPAAIRRIGTLIGAKDVFLREGPLEEIHFDWWLDIVTGGLPGRSLLLHPLCLRLVRAALSAGLARRINGHSVYAEFLV